MCVHVCAGGCTVCTCVYTCVCPVCAGVYVYMCRCVYMRMCTCVHICACVFTCVHTGVCICVCLYVHMCVPVCVRRCAYMCVHVCMYMCVLMCMCTCVYVYVCTYTCVCGSQGQRKKRGKGILDEGFHLLLYILWDCLDVFPSELVFVIFFSSVKNVQREAPHLVKQKILDTLILDCLLPKSQAAAL